MNEVNVVCFKYDIGDVYGPDYVNKLYHMCQRNITLPFRFVCLTEKSDGLDKGIEVFPFPNFEDPPTEYTMRCICWRKLALFDKEFYDLKGKVLLLDLDLVIVDNIDCFFTFSDKLTMPQNWSKPGTLFGQGSVICFDVGKHTHLLQKWRKDPASIYKEYDSEQNYIPEELGRENIEWFPVEWCRSFKDHCMPGGILNSFITPRKIPDGAKIIDFHGHPKPPEAIAGVWGIDVPWYKKLYKTVKPTKWIADYWY
jgi:hypothetical protein